MTHPEIYILNILIHSSIFDIIIPDEVEISIDEGVFSTEHNTHGVYQNYENYHPINLTTNVL